MKQNKQKQKKKQNKTKQKTRNNKHIGFLVARYFATYTILYY